MKNSGHYILGVSLAALLFAGPSGARADATTQVGNTTVTVGGGTALLTLPDVPSLLLRGVNGAPFTLLQTFKSSDNFGDEYGWNINGSIAVPITGMNGRPKWLTLGGFWTNIDDDSTSVCTAGAVERCFVTRLVDNPTIIQTSGQNQRQPVTSRAERDVDHWGVSLEAKWQLNPGVSGVTKAPPRRHVALGADVRGIDQELDENITDSNAAGPLNATYREDLDTTYYGAYVAWGGDYSPFLMKGFWERHGLQSSFLLRGGVYYADTDYNGRLTATNSGGPGNATSALSLSRDDAAFIGGIVLDTRKRIGARSTLSLRSEYEYYSYVPEMAYNQADQSGAVIFSPNGQRGTVIDDDDAFSARTTLRLTVSLSGHPEPVK